MVTFKLIERYEVNAFSAIVVNYLTACIAGFFLVDGGVQLGNILSINNIAIVLLLGVLFILMFNLMGASTVSAGVAVTTVAAKMSVVFPMLLSLCMDSNDLLEAGKVVGIALALVAVFLITKPTGSAVRSKKGAYLPLFVFIGIGAVDSITKYAQLTFVTDHLAPVFNLATFGTAGIVGLALLPFNRPARNGLKRPLTWLFGCALGLLNYGSLYFLLRALNAGAGTHEAIPSSVIFALNSVGVMMLCLLAGLLFKEKLTKLSWVGMGVATAAIVVLAYAV